jgi:hypothetical protein
MRPLDAAKAKQNDVTETCLVFVPPGAHPPYRLHDWRAIRDQSD